MEKKLVCEILSTHLCVDDHIYLQTMTISTLNTGLAYCKRPRPIIIRFSSIDKTIKPIGLRPQHKDNGRGLVTDPTKTQR